jgi:hypothetical protein
MSNIIQLVKEMSTRLNEIAESEQALVRTLGEAMSAVDEKLLQDVRNLAREQEVRREMILLELQGLASRIGTFPMPREQAAGLAYSGSTANPVESANEGARGSGGGDWRQAVRNMQGEVEFYFKSRASSH